MSAKEVFLKGIADPLNSFVAGIVKKKKTGAFPPVPCLYSKFTFVKKNPLPEILCRQNTKAV